MIKQERKLVIDRLPRHCTGRSYQTDMMDWNH